MLPQLITYDRAIGLVTWQGIVEALRVGHMRPRAAVRDVFLGPEQSSLLSRAVNIEGVGYGVKSVTVFGNNPRIGLPSVQGAMLVFDAHTGSVSAILESQLVTELKTAADSVLGTMLLARPDSKQLLIVGAGAVAQSLVRAYSSMFPLLEEIKIWSRNPDQSRDLARKFQDHGIRVSSASDLATAATQSDIVSTATLARDPVLRGEWIRPGTHVDLIGAFRADMREADDRLVSSGQIFVDCRDTAIHHIGELAIPIARGVITADAVLGDLYDLIAGQAAGRTSDDEITIFKNGGGAHLDLMVARHIVDAIPGTALPEK